MPTFNERGNVEVLVERLRVALAGLSWRVVFVDDDSPDGTADLVRRLAADDDRIQVMRRVGRRGLAGAVIEGILSTASPFVAVIDGDLQHDESQLPLMLGALRSGADLAVGTRFASAEGLARGLSPLRLFGSRAATWAAKRVLRAELSDPVSGFFAVRRDVVERVAPRLSPRGFKILFDIVASQAVAPSIVEFPYNFARRADGASKLDSRVVVDYAALLLAKAVRDLVSVSTIIFVAVAVFGLAGHLAVLALALKLGERFIVAQTAAAVAVALAAFFVDGMMRGGRFSIFVRRIVKVAPGAVLGGVANVAVADLAYTHGAAWWLAGLAGAALGAIWTHASRER